ncbi:lactose permease [Colletotrichum scovillei]|nr:lactose permease [Colletotrichum scovillei]
MVVVVSMVGPSKRRAISSKEGPLVSGYTNHKTTISIRTQGMKMV